MDDDEEFTGLFDADLPRADLVSAPAHGVDEWLVMKGTEGGGLLEPDFVRDLIEEAPVPAVAEAGETTLPNGIVIKGSPAAMAAFIHAASVREADPAGSVAKADMSTKSLNDLPDSAFAYIEPGGKKDAEGKTTPRSLRHFAIHDKAHADNAAARIAQGAKFGDKAKPKVEAAQRRFGEKKVSKEAGVPYAVSKDVMDMAGDAVVLDEGIDGMDPTTPLAAPDDEMDVPGDPTDPGSPAWEAIDAATAQKWAGILARAKNALCMLAEREMLEAASADPSDAENAFSLEDAACAIDYAIGNLAVFAAGEQAEAEIGAEMAEMCKALAGFDTAHLDAAEGLAAVAKSGRVLSASNETKIRDAAQALGDVLASLPSAPQAAEPVAKEKEGTVPETKAADVAKETASPAGQARDAAPGEPVAAGSAAALPGDVPGRQVVKAALTLVYDQGRRLVGVTDTESIALRVAKADGDGEKKAMQAVFDQDGDLIGIVDPDAIQPVTGAGGKPAADGTDGDGAQDAAPDAGDMTPQPPADAGTPADAVGKAAGTGVITVTEGALESAVAKAVAAALGAMPPAQDVAKQADVAGALAKVGELEARIAKVEETPAAPKVFTNGQVPPASQLRGQDHGAAPLIDVAKAREMKQRMYTADPAEANRIAAELNRSAITHLEAIHGARR